MLEKIIEFFTYKLTALITLMTNDCTNNFLNDFRCDYHSRNTKVKYSNALQEIIYVLAMYDHVIFYR
jgi:hypothetical protein